MKICIISHCLHPYSESTLNFKHSSVNDVLFNLSQGFKSAGHDIFLILPKKSDSLFPSFIATGDYQPNLSSHHTHNHNLISSSTNSGLSQMMDYAFSHQHEFDVIINLGNDWLPIYMADKFKTLYITIPNLFFDGRSLESLIKDRALNFPDNVLFISHYLKSSLGSSFNKVVYLPFDSSLFLPANKNKDNFLFWAGRIVPEKGLKESLLFARQLNIPLFVAGEIQNLSYFHQLSNQFEFNYLGILEKPALYSYMNRAKALLQFQQDSFVETFGRVTVESLLNGCPVIYKDNGANKELVSLTNGGVEFTSSPSNTLQALSSIDVQVVQALAKTHFSRDIICSQLINHFTSLLNKHL